MDPNVIRAAKAIPNRFQRPNTLMFSESEQDLMRAVSDLQQTLGTVEEYVRSIDHAPTTKAAAQPAAGNAAPGAGRRGRRRGQSGTGECCVLGRLRANPRGVRPLDIAEKLNEVAMGKHVDALALSAE